jgi:hypothetical protein
LIKKSICVGGAIVVVVEDNAVVVVVRALVVVVDAAVVVVVSGGVATGPVICDGGCVSKTMAIPIARNVDIAAVLRTQWSINVPRRLTVSK